jgi:hypothetical protein
MRRVREVFRKTGDLMPWLRHAKDVEELVSDMGQNNVEVHNIDYNYFEKNRPPYMATLYVGLTDNSAEDIYDYFETSRVYQNLVRMYDITSNLETALSNNQVAFKLFIEG